MPPKRKTTAATSTTQDVSSIGNRHTGTAAYVRERHKMVAESAKVGAQLEMLQTMEKSIQEHWDAGTVEKRDVVTRAQELVSLEKANGVVVKETDKRAREMQDVLESVQKAVEAAEERLRTIAEERTEIIGLSDSVWTTFSNIHTTMAAILDKGGLVRVSRPPQCESNATRP